MSDRGHELTDDLIEELEKRLEKEYSRAYKEVARKTKAYFDKFAIDDAAMKARVDAGEITREYWLQWRYNHMMTGKRWIEMRDTLAEDLMKIDSKARSIINEHTPEAYALNHNYATFQVEKDSMINTSYTLYNREAVENILKDDPKLLPYPRTESKTAKELRERADLIWNRQKLNNEITQGILQGEPIKDIAKRLQRVVGMDGRAALRNARTMMTSAENKGREDAYDALEEKGVELDRQWVATLDDRTRHSHRLLHGEIKDRKTGLYSNGLKYPADPDGDPAEVYNCRCSEIATVTGFPIDIPKWSPKMGDMTYEEWLGEHEEKPVRSEKVTIERPASEPSFMKQFKMFDEQPTQQEILTQVNPNYSKNTKEWTHNCQRCVVAEEAMYRGYDVTAKAYNKNDAVGSSGVACWKFNASKWWNDPDVSVVPKKSDLFNTIENCFSQWGNGSRAVIRVKWQAKYGGSGHFISASSDENGKVVFKNPQSGEIIDLHSDDWFGCFSQSRNQMWIMRVDNREFSENVGLAIENRGAKHD